MAGAREQFPRRDSPVFIHSRQQVVLTYRDRDHKPVALQALAAHLSVGNALLEPADDRAGFFQHVIRDAPHGYAAPAEEIRALAHADSLPAPGYWLDFEQVQPFGVQRAADDRKLGEFGFQVEERPASDDVHLVHGLQAAAAAHLDGLHELDWQGVGVRPVCAHRGKGRRWPLDHFLVRAHRQPVLQSLAGLHVQRHVARSAALALPHQHMFLAHGQLLVAIAAGEDERYRFSLWFRVCRTVSFSNGTRPAFKSASWLRTSACPSGNRVGKVVRSRGFSQDLRQACGGVYQ